MCVRVVAFSFGFTASENMFDLLQVTPEVKDAPNAEDLKLSTGTGGLVAPFWLLVLVPSDACRIASTCVRACVRVCVRACVRACVCVCACVRACVRVSLPISV